MRTLKFIVDGQSIRQDPSCDFSNIVKGTKGYLQAQFTFDKDWAGCRKAAVFLKHGKEYPAPLKGDMCEIPAEVLTWKKFSVRVVGEKDGYRITTNEVEVMQNG